MIALLSLLLFMIAHQLDEANTIFKIKEKEMQEQVGTTIVIKNDSLVIVDYSVFDNTYLLDNGTRISAVFIEKDNK